MNQGLRRAEELPIVVREELETLIRALLAAWDKEHSSTDGHQNLTLNGLSVTLGANDSGGAGYRLLRVPNA